MFPVNNFMLLIWCIYKFVNHLLLVVAKSNSPRRLKLGLSNPHKICHKWVMKKAELLKRLEALEKENAQLKAQIAALEKRLGLNSSNSSKERMPVVVKRVTRDIT